jgi:hypothetical protein
MMRLLECGCCGSFHPDTPMLAGWSQNYFNDCRNDANRFNSAEDYTTRTGVPAVELSMTDQMMEVW